MEEGSKDLSLLSLLLAPTKTMAVGMFFGGARELTLSFLGDEDVFLLLEFAKNSKILNRFASDYLFVTLYSISKFLLFSILTAVPKIFYFRLISAWGGGKLSF